MVEKNERNLLNIFIYKTYISRYNVHILYKPKSHAGERDFRLNRCVATCKFQIAFQVLQ